MTTPAFTGSETIFAGIPGSIRGTQGWRTFLAAVNSSEQMRATLTP
jgi:hypothetical protein